ncbi:MAG: 3-hydroxyacyl-CoA dehydrogenase NAD-binding domain-containing protein [Hyphomicrobiaceae bacterium]
MLDSPQTQKSSADLADLKDWHFEIDFEDIAWATFDREGESANTLGQRPMEELGAIVSRMEQAAAAKEARGLVIMSAKPRSFISGADIREFDNLGTEAKVVEGIQEATALLDRLEALPVPTVAAIHGFCLGGGLELAMACDYRIADKDDSTRIGLPEVKLGIFPGFHGTVRSIRLAGPVNAMQAMLTGRMYRSGAARGMGLIDRLVDSKHSLRWAARKAVLKKSKSKGASAIQSALRKWPARGFLASQMREKTAAKVREDHYPAPFALIDLFENFGDEDKRMKAAETRAFAPLMVSDTAANLRRVFALSERLKGQAPKNAFKPQRIHVIGAGTMGADIAAHCVASGMQVSLQDLSEDALKEAQARAKKHFKKRLKKKRAVDAALARLVLDKDGKHIPRADVIIEAIVEKLEIKQKVFGAIEPKLKEGAVMASNTSSLPIEDIAGGLKDPGRLIGLHFFNPVPQLPLVEVVKSPASRNEEIEKGCTFVTAISKFPLITKSTPGFLVNRVLAPYMMAAMERYESGVEREKIDQAAKEFGMPVGPLELADQVGLDICMHVAEILGIEGGAGAGSKTAKLVASGKLGKKSGEGFYVWEKGKPKTEDHSYEKEELAALGKDLVQPLLDECEACLADKVVDDADLIDAGVIFGTGFAPFRGGPMHYLATIRSGQSPDTEDRAAA